MESSRMLRLEYAEQGTCSSVWKEKTEGPAGTVALCNKIATNRLWFGIEDLHGYLNFTQMLFHLS
jgi:hypothetical protein